jgi:hypothetical protein
MGVVQMKLLSGLFWAKEAVKAIPMAAEAGILQNHQPMDPLRKELPGLLLEPLHHRTWPKGRTGFI